MIKYIGSKRVLVPRIVELVEALSDVETVVDLFSGTARVGRALKQRGYSVTANDHTAYAHALATCYVQADAGRWRKRAARLIDELQRIPPREGYFTETFCVRSRYFQAKNGARIDAMREHIARLQLEPELEAIALVSLMEAADRVDSTCGVQMAYLKKWAPRASNDLVLRLPELTEGRGQAMMCDALQAARQLTCDLVYIDPPYNQHKYMNNYHVWESLVRWDKPEVYGTACKRLDCKEYDSDFNSKRRIADAFRALVQAVRARYLVVSFNDEGYLGVDDVCEVLAARGSLRVLRVEYKRYVGAQIGIYNPAGEKVGRIGRLKNQELLFLVDCAGPNKISFESPTFTGRTLPLPYT